MPAPRTLDRDAIARLHHQGLTGRQIAQQLGYSEDAVGRIRKVLGLNPGRRMTPERRERIQAMLADGWSWMEITRTEGASWDTLNRHFPGTAWSDKQCDEHRTHVRRVLAGPIPTKKAA